MRALLIICCADDTTQQCYTKTKLQKCLVPSSRLELLRLSALPPQDSVSTNFTTRASWISLNLPSEIPYFGISVPFCAGAEGAVAGAIGTTLAGGFTKGVLVDPGITNPFVFAGADAGASFITPCITPLPPVRWAPKYVNARLVEKNTTAAIEVARLKKFAEPAAPKTLPADPLPKDAPISAPLPC